MAPVFCLMLNRICFRQNGNKIWSRAWASLCSGPFMLRNEANERTYHPSQRSQWCHQGKAQCQLYQGVQSPGSSHRHTLWLWCGTAISLLLSHDSVTRDITWTLLLQKNSDTNAHVERESALEMLGHSLLKFLSWRVYVFTEMEALFIMTLLPIYN